MYTQAPRTAADNKTPSPSPTTPRNNPIHPGDVHLQGPELAGLTKQLCTPLVTRHLPALREYRELDWNMWICVMETEVNVIEAPPTCRFEREDVNENEDGRS